MENKRKIHRPSPVVVEEEKIKIPVFPQEIVVEILSRLPVKPLCRFRCVSKHWLSLISDPQLAKSHLMQTITNVCLYFKRQKIILSWLSLYSLEYESIGRIGGFDENLVALELDYPLKMPNAMAEALLEVSTKNGPVRWEINEETGEDVLHVPFPLVYNVDVFGSCNGLVCISPDPNTLYLFNPSTRESKRIPDSPSGFGPKTRGFYRFGFGCVNDDYKIVKVGYGVFVYSLRADSWTFVCHSPYYGEMHEPGVLLNGAIHWMTSHREEDDDHHECVIAAFSLEDEVFIDMPSPDIVDYYYEFVVGVLNGCLCVLHTRSETMHNDIWVMTEYGVAESWTKITLSFSYGSMKPLSLAQNGEALLQVDGKLMQYNFEDGSKRYVVVEGMPKWDFFAADTYFETLVSPNDAF